MTSYSTKKYNIHGIIKLCRDRFGDAPSYSQTWRAVVSGVIPATRCGREWRMDETAAPILAEHFGIVSRSAA